MSYGFLLRNANGQITISDIQFNPVYIGQAVFQPPAGAYAFTTEGIPFVEGTGVVLTYSYGFSIGVTTIARYRITYATDRGKPLPFIIQDERIVHGASINAIKEISQSGGNTTWEIVLNICNSRSNDVAGQPRVIVFSSLPPNESPSGYGMYIKASQPSAYAGRTAFNSNYKHLLPNQVFSYSTSNVKTVVFPNTTETFTVTSYTSTQLLSNIPSLPAFFYQQDISDITNARGSLRNVNTAIGRIRGSYFESTVMQINYAKTADVYYTKSRGSEPLIIIDASKYL